MQRTHVSKRLTALLLTLVMLLGIIPHGPIRKVRNR